MREKIDSFIKAHDYPCWCGTRTSRLVCKQLYGRRPFAVVQCPECGTHRILPRALASESAAEALYNEYTEDIFSTEDLRDFKQRTLARSQRVGITFQPGTTVLDVGCGSGYLLNAICDEFGCSGKGIDVDKRRIARAVKQAGRAEFECGLFDPDRISERYDVVFLNAVIEHVVDPVSFLRSLSTVLKPAGNLFILTPNAQSLSYRVLGSWWRELLSVGEHIYLFTPSSLQRCAEASGLEMIAQSSDYDFVAGRPRFATLREAAIAMWWLYREAVKRASSILSGDLGGDILYARLRKAQVANRAPDSTS